VKSKLSLLLILSLLFGPCGYTAPRPLPDEKLEAYKLAVILALRDSSFNCSGTGTTLREYEFEGLIIGAAGFEVKTNGQQPMLVFRSSNKSQNQYFVYVTTSADNKTILKMQAQTYVQVGKYKNTGDLKNPVITTVITLDETGVTFCNRK
jgi:hypothetical protein